MTVSKPALVFGASGEQGRAVIEGFIDAGYSPVYGFTSLSGGEEYTDQYLTDALGCVLVQGDLANPDDVRKAFLSTKAQAIFLTTTTDMPSPENDVGLATAMEDEYNVIVQWFNILKEVYAEDKLQRTVVFSTRDNVQELCRKEMEHSGEVWIEPLDDGSIVPHYSGICNRYIHLFDNFISHRNRRDLKFSLSFYIFTIPSQGKGRRGSLETVRGC